MDINSYWVSGKALVLGNNYSVHLEGHRKCKTLGAIFFYFLHNRHKKKLASSYVLKTIYAVEHNYVYYVITIEHTYANFSF